MASFSVKSFERKLKEMSSRQDSVQTVSLWLIHHRAHSKTVVSLWHDHIKKGEGLDISTLQRSVFPEHLFINVEIQ